MTKQKLFFLLIILTFPAVGALVWAEQDAMIADIQKSFDNTKTMSATFTQETYNKGFGRKTISKGKMYLHKPAKMRWEYEEPAGLLMVIDGEKLWHYDPEDKTAYYDNLEGYLHTKSPAMFLAGEEPLENLFNIDLVPAKKEDKIDVKAFRLVPKAPQPGIKAMLMKVDGSTHDIVELIIVDHLGNRNSLKFAEIDRPTQMDPALFQFVLPEGAHTKSMPRP